MALVVTTCPACSKATRVPDDRGRIRVTCPTCAHRWSYPIMLDTAASTPIVCETAAIMMRCSVKGQAYQVNFTRPNPSVCFSIRDIALIQTHETAALQSGPRPQPVQPINLSDLSFDGFQCPSCAILGTAKRWQFIRCYACNQLICTGSLQADNNFRCVCGSAGWLDVSLPPITTINGTTQRETTRPMASQVSQPITAKVAGTPPSRLLR